MTRQFLIFLSILSTTIFFGQTDSIDYFVSKLDNNQFSADMTYIGIMLKSYSPAKDALIKIGKPATDKLIASLKDSTKFIVSYLTLCDIWSYKVWSHGIKFDSIQKRAYMEIGESEKPYLILIEKMVDKNSAKWLPDKNNIDTIIKFWRRKTKVKSNHADK